MMRTVFISAAGLSLASTTYAAIASTYNQNIGYQLSIPSSTASSGSGDIYFQLSAPTSYQWVALGQGSGMAGSNIFVMYTSADGTNVTVSPRLGTGHRQPLHDTAAQITVLEGSGVQNGVMTANVRCSLCGSWQGGSMDFTGSSSNWIHAYRTGSALNSDDLAENIVQHNKADTFTWDLTQARGGADSNPFVTSGTTATIPASPASTSTAASGTSSSSAGGQSKQHRILTAHAVCAGIAFVALFPIGAILIRVASFAGVMWVHVGIQATALVLFIAAFGLGINLAVNGKQFHNAHPIIGIVLFSLLLIQPVLGWMHHTFYKRTSDRTLWSHAHLTLGRVIVPLGLINGGLGLRLASAGRSAKIAYGVCAGVVGVAYMAAVMFGEVRRSRSPGSNERGEKIRSPRAGSANPDA